MILKTYLQKSRCNQKPISSLNKFPCSVVSYVINKRKSFTYSTALYNKKHTLLGKHAFNASRIGMKNKWYSIKTKTILGLEGRLAPCGMLTKKVIVIPIVELMNNRRQRNQGAPFVSIHLMICNGRTTIQQIAVCTICYRAK